MKHDSCYFFQSVFVVASSRLHSESHSTISCKFLQGGKHQRTAAAHEKGTSVLWLNELLWAALPP